MKEYKIFIPVTVDGVKMVKEFRIKANSVTEAYLTGVAYVNEILKNLTFNQE